MEFNELLCMACHIQFDNQRNTSPFRFESLKVRFIYGFLAKLLFKFIVFMARAAKSTYCYAKFSRLIRIFLT